VEAVQCAVETQAALAELNSSLQLIAALASASNNHAGDLFGDGVNIA
jgi:hypothetical protein